MIKNHLSRILGEIGMTQAELSKRIGIRPATINEWYHKIVVRVNLDHLNRICEVLKCNVCDLIEYTPSSNHCTSIILEEHGNRKTN